MVKTFLSYFGWAFICLASLYFMYTRVLPFVLFKDGIFENGYLHYVPWLMFHILTGTTALILGPFQFITSIRKTYPVAHRTMGAIYLCCVAVAAPTALRIAIGKEVGDENNLVHGLGLGTLATVWFISSAMAYWAARVKNFDQHREWMIRSFVLTLSFTGLRLIEKVMIEGLGMEPFLTYNISCWAGWVIPLLATEMILQGRKIARV